MVDLGREFYLRFTPITKTMTVVWRGYGFLALVLPFVGALAPMMLDIDSNLNASIGFIIGSAIAMMIGWRLNGPPKQITAKKGQKAISVKIHHHELFYVSMQLCSFLFLLVGILTMVGLLIVKAESITSLLSSAMWIILVAFVAYNYYQEKRVRKWLKKYKGSSSESTTKSHQKEGNTLKRTSKNKIPKSSTNTIDASKLSEEQRQKRAAIAKIKEQRGKINDYITTDHSKYQP